MSQRMKSYIHAQGRRFHSYLRRPLPPRFAGASAGSATWSVPDLCAAYSWPRGLAGNGVIAIVELGGGWVQSDMDAFFKSIAQPNPQITDVSVDATKNTPEPGPDSADSEVALDIQVAAASYFVATGRPAVIRMYWSQDIAAAVRAATKDGCDVCSISWGADEAMWGKAAADDMELAATEATAAGMVVFAAAGDNDSADRGSSPANVDVPASCPHVIGCGGTSKTATSEVVWNNDPGNPSGQGTGGGYSTLFRPMPDWQRGAPHGAGRMVPDVSANADPNTGYQIVLHGQQIVVGGTSAVAPLYAGLFAAFGTKLGFVTPTLWENQPCFNDITQGDNGKYRAASGPDPCTGIGTPIGSRLLGIFPLYAHAAHEDQIKAMQAENLRLRSEISVLQAGFAGDRGTHSRVVHSLHAENVRLRQQVVALRGGDPAPVTAALPSLSSALHAQNVRLRQGMDDPAPGAPVPQ